MIHDIFIRFFLAVNSTRLSDGNLGSVPRLAAGRYNLTFPVNSAIWTEEFEPQAIGTTTANDCSGVENSCLN